MEESPEKVRKSHVKASISRQNASGTKRVERDWVLDVERAVEKAANHCFATALASRWAGTEARRAWRVGSGVFGTGWLITMADR